MKGSLWIIEKFDTENQGQMNWTSAGKWKKKKHVVLIIEENIDKEYYEVLHQDGTIQTYLKDMFKLENKIA
jgi:hypothetical protein